MRRQSFISMGALLAAMSLPVVVPIHEVDYSSLELRVLASLMRG